MVTLEQLKLQVRVMPEETHSDGELQISLDAAINHLASIDVDMAGDPLPPAITQAVLMLAAHFFGNKEATTAEQIRSTPLGVDRLIAPYREISL